MTHPSVPQNDSRAARRAIKLLYADDEFPIFSVDLFVHQRWLEPRLELPEDIFEEGDDYVTLPPEFFDNLWQPDPYFLNSKVAGKAEGESIVLHIPPPQGTDQRRRT